jgi:crotonobetainyl-CoA:carnitine CoA-transferase CaiB-like acyl-CoA transferase
VIKVEAPKNGDEYRNLSQMSDGYNIAIEFMNRGKKSLTLDIRKPEARPVMEKLIKWCDVLCENYKPGTLNGYGYTYEQCAALNPGIIYCTNSGFGDQGPMGHLGSFDGVAQAFTGVMHAQGGGPEMKPMPMEFAFSNEVGAMSFVQGILMAIVHKARTEL